MSEFEREEMEVDILFVGGGIANLTAAYSLMKEIQEYNEKAEKNDTPPIEEPVILVIDKGAKIGNHVLSGAVFDPKAFNELFPDMAEEDSPFSTPVSAENVKFLTSKSSYTIPHGLLPKEMKSNEGCHLISLTELTVWMGAQCEEIGVEVYSEFAAKELLYNDDGGVKGVRLGDTGQLHDATPGPAYTPGMDVFANVTVLGEGSHGSLSQDLIEKFKLAENANPQVYALGIKELIKIPQGRVNKGEIIHTFGYPLESSNYGGSFVYGYEDDLVGIGLVIGLDYSNAMVNVHENFLQLKKHPVIEPLIEGGEVMEYGANTLPEGGYFAIPKLTVDGALLVGDSAGMLNAMRLKGAHLAMKSGMLAAQKICQCMISGSYTAAELDYREEFDASWAGEEMFSTKNFRQGFHGGMISGMINTGLHMVSGGALPKGRKNLPADHTRMKKASHTAKQDKIKTEGKWLLDIMGDVYLSGTMHREDEPSHITFRDQELLSEDYALYQSPSTRFCPAEVYERKDGPEDQFTGIQVNFSNCLHCKTCVIKDPLQNINWVPPEGGDGPKYKKM